MPRSWPPTFMPLIRARHLWLFAPALLLVVAWSMHQRAGLQKPPRQAGEAIQDHRPAASVSGLAPGPERSAAFAPMQAQHPRADFQGQANLYRYALQLQSVAEGGDAQASWMLSRVYDYCASYAVDPAGYQADQLMMTLNAAPGVQTMLAARERVASRCTGFTPRDGLGAQALMLQRLRAAEAGSLAAEAALLSQGAQLDDSPDYRRALVQRVLVSRDPQAYLAIAPAMGVAARGDGSYRGLVAGTQFSQLAWELAACQLGLDCDAHSALMTGYCANGGICSQDPSQNFADFVRDAAVPRQSAATLDDMVSTLVNGSGEST